MGARSIPAPSSATSLLLNYFSQDGHATEADDRADPTRPGCWRQAARRLAETVTILAAGELAYLSLLSATVPPPRLWAERRSFPGDSLPGGALRRCSAACSGSSAPTASLLLRAANWRATPPDGQRRRSPERCSRVALALHTRTDTLQFAGRLSQDDPPRASAPASASSSRSRARHPRTSPPTTAWIDSRRRLSPSTREAKL